MYQKLKYHINYCSLYATKCNVLRTERYNYVIEVLQEALCFEKNFIAN